MNSGQVLRVLVEFTSNTTTLPGLQIYALTSSAQTVAYSDHMSPESSILGGSIRLSAQGSTVRSSYFRVNFVPSEVTYMPVLFRAPREMPIRDFAESMKCQIGFDDETDTNVFESESLHLNGEGSEVDWFVVGIIRFIRDLSDRLVEVQFKDVSSFPSRTGDIEPQLQELIEVFETDQPDEEGWKVLRSFEGEISPKTIASRNSGASPRATLSRSLGGMGDGAVTFAPVSPALSNGMCRGCELKDLEIQALKFQLVQKESELKMQPGTSSANTLASSGIGGSVKHLSEELSKLRDREADFLTTIEKQKILIEQLRMARQSSLVEKLVTDSYMMFTDDIKGPELRKDTDVAVQLVQQEELIVAIKEQLLKLSSQVKNGLRIRALN